MGIKKRKHEYIVGIDEVGRGPLAGPITLCAVCMTPKFGRTLLRGIKDSKKLSHEKRVEWYKRLQEEKKKGNLRYTLTSVSAKSIDTIGISRATARAIRSILTKLDISPTVVEILLDGSLRAPEEFTYQRTIIKGDEKIPIIGSASIIAKVSRDRRMTWLAKKYPGYGFEIHKGYGTALHRDAIRRLGPSELHRKSFLTKLFPGT